MDPSYEIWQQALAEEFFGQDRAGHPLLFYVDRDVERDLMVRHGIAVPLGDAVGRCVFPRRPDPYDHLDEYQRRKRREDREAVPAVLPLLAASVLAATRMMSDSEHRANNFHARFSQLLTGDDRALGSKEFKEVARLWTVLANWLADNGGSHGVGTIPARGDLPSNQSQIGFALSQALLQGTDRNLLPELFTRLRQQNPAAWPPSGQSVAASLEVHGWTDRFSAGFRRALATGDLRPVATSVLGNLAATWDGSPTLTAPGTPRGALLVLMESKRLSWIARIPQALSGGDVPELTGGAQLSRIGDSDYFAVTGIGTPDRESIARGVRIRGKHLVLSAAPASVVVLARVREVGSNAWASAESLEAGERYAVLASPSAGHSVKRLLDKAESTGRQRDRDELSWVPQGWSLHMPVVWDSDFALRQALDAAGGAVAGLRPTPRFALRLEGGLKLAPRLDPDLYLCGGEPSLVLPEGTEGDIVIDSYALPGLRGLYPEGTPVPLTGVSLPEGHHTVQVGDAAVNFSTAVALPTPASVERPCGFSLTDGKVSSAYPSLLAGAAEAEALRGADAGTLRVTPAASVVLCRRRVRGLLFAASDGRLWEIAHPDAPEWWSRRLPKATAPDQPYLFEVSVDPSVSGWLLEQRPSGWEGRPVNALSIPKPTPESRSWAEAVLAARGCSPTPEWAAYVAAAKEIVQ